MENSEFNICNACRIFSNGTARTAFYIAVGILGASLWSVNSENGKIIGVHRYLDDDENKLYLDMVNLGYSIESVRKFYDNCVKYVFMLKEFAVDFSNGCKEEIVNDEPVLVLRTGVLHADNYKNDTEKALIS